jgi:hypothetical protein
MYKAGILNAYCRYMAATKDDTENIMAGIWQVRRMKFDWDIGLLGYWDIEILRYLDIGFLYTGYNLG